jgi:hypothetical protein
MLYVAGWAALCFTVRRTVRRCLAGFGLAAVGAAALAWPAVAAGVAAKAGTASIATAAMGARI